MTAAGGGGSPGPLTVASVPASAGGGPPAEATLQHFVFHAPPRRQFLMPLLSAELSERSQNQVRTLFMRSVHHPGTACWSPPPWHALPARSQHRQSVPCDSALRPLLLAQVCLLRPSSQGCAQNAIQWINILTESPELQHTALVWVSSDEQVVQTSCQEHRFMPHAMLSQQELMALYARVHEAMAGPADAAPGAAAPPLQRQHFAADLARTVLAYAGPEYVVYAVFRRAPSRQPVATAYPDLNPYPRPNTSPDPHNIPSVKSNPHPDPSPGLSPRCLACDKGCRPNPHPRLQADGRPGCCAGSHHPPVHLAARAAGGSISPRVDCAALPACDALSTASCSYSFYIPREAMSADMAGPL